MIGIALVACLVASATATGYIDGREYVYRYNGFVYSGYPRIKPQEAGYSYSVDLRIQPDGDSAIFKVENARKAQFNGEFEDVTHAKHQYAELPPHAEFLTRPFRVHRKQGVVTHFEVSRDEPSFSINLKRGIVSLFNLNFDPQESSTGVPSTEDNDIQRPEHDPHYYKVYEDSILGECETAYVVEHHPFHRDHNIVLNVTKVRNFHKCRSRPNQVYGVFHGYECGEVDHEKAHTLHGNAHYHYSIRGDRHHYIIEKIRSESDVAYTPYPLEGQTVSTIIKRSLELVSEGPVTDRLEAPGDLMQLNSLVYEFDHQKDFREPVDLKKPHYLYHLTGRKAPISDIRHLVDELSEVYSDESYAQDVRDRNYPAKFVELLRAVATIGYDEIDDLYKTYADTPEKGATEEQKRHRSLFMDVLVNLGTNPAFLYGKHLIEAKKLNGGEAAYFVQQLQFHLKEASETLLDQLQELCSSEPFRRNPQLHVTCVMTLSNVVFDRCVARYHPEGLRGGNKQDCPPEIATKYFGYLAKLYESTTNEKMRSYYIKAASNIGVKEIIPYVAPYVEGRVNVHRMYRENALWGLTKVGHRYPDKVRALVVPLLFNRTEPHDLRLSAFIMLLMHRPELYEIEGVARAIKYDTDDQVRSFIYSTFKAVANSTHICDRRLSKQARYALRILEDVHHEFEHYDYAYSQHHYFAGYDKDFDFGGSTRFAYYASENGHVPRTVYLGLEDYVGGKSMHTVGLGIKQFGLDRFIDKMFGPEGSFGQRSLFDLFKKRAKRDTNNNQKELNEIKGKLNLPVHDYEPILGELFFKYMGNHLWSYQFDDKTFEHFFKEGRFVIPNLPAAWERIPAFSYQRFMLTIDQLYVMPTESGIPLIFDYKQPVYYFHKNKESSFKVEPGFFPEDRGGQWPNSVALQTDGHFVVDKNLFAYMGVAIPFDQVVFGAGVNRRSTLSLPLKLQLRLGVQEKKLSMKWTPVAPHNIYHFQYEPFTFVDSYANAVPLPQEEKYLPVRRVHRHEVERHFFHEELGLGFDVHTDTENEFNDFGSWVDFLLKKDFREKFYYLYANPHFEPYHVHVKFSQAAQNPTTEVDTDFTYQFSADNWVIPHFPEEGFEEFDHRQRDPPHYTCALKGNMVAKGRKERKVHAVASWTRDLLRTFHKVNFFYERTPFAAHETQPLKVCGSSYLKYPRYDLTKFATLDTVDLDHTVKTELKVHFGKDCKSDQKFEVQGLITETEEQHAMESRREEPDTPEHYNPYAYHYQGCLEERKRGINYGEHCWAYYDLVTTLHKYTFHVKHQGLSDRFLNRTYLLDRVLKFAFYTHSDHDEIKVANSPEEFHLEANISLKLPVADVRVRKPASNTNYYNVYLPHYVGFSSYPFFEDAHIKNSFSDVDCSVEGDHVTTFDRFEYDLPPIDCWKVIARDCSPQQLFTVLATKIQHPKYHKAVKVFLGDHKVEALPVSDDSDIIIRVDGKKVAVGTGEPYLHKEGEDPMPIFYVTQRDFFYALHSEKYGLIVEYDGRGVYVQVSPYYRAKLCGLCGNYNGQKYDGSANPEGCYYEDEKAYAYSNTIPSDTCQVPRAEPICPTEGGFGCTRLRTKVIPLNTGKVPQTCFSTEPVTECAAHCKATGTVTRRVPFHCLPAKDDSTKALLREQERRVLGELARKSRDHEDTVEVPERCVKS